MGPVADDIKTFRNENKALQTKVNKSVTGAKIHVRTVAIYREPHHRRIHRNLHVRFGFRETDHLPNRHREMYELGNKVSVVCGQIKVEEYLPGIRYSV